MDREKIPSPLVSALRRARRTVHELLGQDIHFSPSLRRPSIFLGTTYGGWNIIPEFVPARPTVFSFGIGTDISFDLAMIRRFNATVFGFDPTPKAIAWIQSHNDLPPQFQLIPVGLAGFDGTIELGLNRPDWESYSVATTPAESCERISCKVARFATLAKDLNVRHVDVLKMDIEGCEYDAMPDLLASGMIFKQICIELHYRKGNNYLTGKTIFVILNL